LITFERKPIQNVTTFSKTGRGRGWEEKQLSAKKEVQSTPFIRQLSLMQKSIHSAEKLMMK
jgi:hypothetical protein